MPLFFCLYFQVRISKSIFHVLHRHRSEIWQEGKLSHTYRNHPSHQLLSCSKPTLKNDDQSGTARNAIRKTPGHEYFLSLIHRKRTTHSSSGNDFYRNCEGGNNSTRTVSKRKHSSGTHDCSVSCCSLYHPRSHILPQHRTIPRFIFFPRKLFTFVVGWAERCDALLGHGTFFIGAWYLLGGGMQKEAQPPKPFQFWQNERGRAKVINILW